MRTSKTKRSIPFSKQKLKTLALEGFITFNDIPPPKNERRVSVTFKFQSVYILRNKSRFGVIFLFSKPRNFSQKQPDEIHVRNLNSEESWKWIDGHGQVS